MGLFTGGLGNDRYIDCEICGEETDVMGGVNCIKCQKDILNETMTLVTEFKTILENTILKAKKTEYCIEGIHSVIDFKKLLIAQLEQIK